MFVAWYHILEEERERKKLINIDFCLFPHPFHSLSHKIKERIEIDNFSERKKETISSRENLFSFEEFFSRMKGSGGKRSECDRSGGSIKLIDFSQRVKRIPCECGEREKQLKVSISISAFRCGEKKNIFISFHYLDIRIWNYESAIIIFISHLKEIERDRKSWGKKKNLKFLW